MNNKQKINNNNKIITQCKYKQEYKYNTNTNTIQ